MVWKPHVTVAALAERDSRFLMVEEFADGRQVFNQPAGHLDDGERLLDAVVRETWEETAWRFTPDALVGIYQWRHPGNEQTFLRVLFCGDVSDHDENHELDSAIVRSVWMTRDELARREKQLRSPMVLRCIDDYLFGIRHPLSILVDAF
ncbi:MAG: NUDIX hydrolase [Gammaproteobacteria bacterium]